MGSCLWSATVLGPLSYSTWLLLPLPRARLVLLCPHRVYYISIHSLYLASCVLLCLQNFVAALLLTVLHFLFLGGHLSMYFPTFCISSWFYNFLTIQTLSKLSLPIHTLSTMPIHFLSHLLAVSIFGFSRREIVKIFIFITEILLNDNFSHLNISF